MSPKEWEKRKAELLEQLSLLEADVEYLRKSIPEIRQIVLETTADGTEETDKKIDAILNKQNIWTFCDKYVIIYVHYKLMHV